MNPSLLMGDLGRFVGLAAAFVGSTDFLHLLVWQGATAVLGALIFPFVSRLFSPFFDGGWPFARVLAVLGAAWLQWLLSALHLVPYGVLSQGILVILLAGACLAGFRGDGYRRAFRVPGRSRIVAAEEGLFLLLFLGWALVRACNPAILGLEKFMDFGFMTASLRTAWMPPTDMWHAGAPINYYYFGHYLAGWLTRLTHTIPERGYNLMLAFLFAQVFLLSLSLVTSLAARALGDLRTALLAGLLAGALVALGGNLHCPIYAHALPAAKEAGLWKGEVKPYWYPDATRFIGYFPSNDDKTIHEFPIYSFVVADLHGHVSNLPGVLTFLGLVSVLLIRRRGGGSPGAVPGEAREGKRPGRRGGRKSGGPAAPPGEPRAGERSLPTAKASGRMEGAEGASDLLPRLLARVPEPLRGAEFLLLAPLLAIFLMTNTWDYPIYLTVAGGALFLRGLTEGPREGETVPRLWGRSLQTALTGGAALFLVSQCLALPFLLSFENIARGVGLVRHRSALWQLGVLWGYQVFLGLLFLGFLLREAGRKGLDASRVLPTGVADGPEGAVPRIPFMTRFLALPREDLTILFFFAAALGLILMPEIVYVRDIYESGYHRANTMFKLTYQGFLLFALASGYAAVRMADAAPRRFAGVLARAGLGVLAALPLLYASWAMNGFYDIPAPAAYRGLDGLAFLGDAHGDDRAAVEWLRARARGQEPILEAYGDSYTEEGRISMATGLPTIQGWYVHEWLWRGTPEEPRTREAEVRRVYEAPAEGPADLDPAREVLRKYRIRYLVIGSREREKFRLSPERVDALAGLGRVVLDRPALKLVELPRWN
jgi:uncharacterized membrane protein